MHLTPLEHASAILGEHMENYVIIAVSQDSPRTALICYDSKFAADGLLKHATNVVNQEIEVDSEVEFVWDEEEDEEDSS
jgi:uncharacterized OB-fold protein